MTSFTVRVELHDATWTDYNLLHTEMENQGFGRTITAGDGTTYELPEAEYDYSGDVNKADVLARAKEAADTTGKKYAVLVTKSNGRTWVGLSKS
jgi:hypothetical protein